MSLAGFRERLTRRRVIVWSLLGLLVVGVVFLGWTSLRVWQAWRNVPRVQFDPEASRRSLEERGPLSPATTATPEEGLATPVDWPVLDVPDDDFDAYLVLGSDESARKPSIRADAILLFLQPRDGAPPALISIPRDLLVRNPCDGQFWRINVLLEGCEDLVTGPELLALAVEDLTGVAIDHFGLFGLEAFRRVINYVGGIQICTKHPVRIDEASGLLLAEGCNNATGVTVLRWVRMRTGEELVDGQWQAMTRLGDAERSRRQRIVLVQLLGKLQGFRSPQRVAEIAEALSDAFIIDDRLSIGGAVDLLWDLRGIDRRDIQQPSLTVETGVTGDGEFAVVLTEPFSTVLVEAYPPAADYPVVAASGES